MVQSQSPQPTQQPHMQPIVEYPSRYSQAAHSTQHRQPIVEYPPRYPQAAPPATSADNDVVMTTKSHHPPMDCTRYGIDRAVFLFLRIGALFEF